MASARGPPLREYLEVRARFGDLVPVYVGRQRDYDEAIRQLKSHDFDTRYGADAESARAILSILRAGLEASEFRLRLRTAIQATQEARLLPLTYFRLQQPSPSCPEANEIFAYVDLESPFVFDDKPLSYDRFAFIHEHLEDCHYCPWEFCDMWRSFREDHKETLGADLYAKVHRLRHHLLLSQMRI